MIRFSCFTLALIGVLTLTILGIRWGNGGRDTSRFSLLFTNPDGSPCQRPCLVGVRTEGMTFDQVRSVLDSHPVLQGRNFSGGISAAYTVGDLISDVDISYGYGSVPSALYTFGEVINLLGAPSHATFNAATGCVNLYFASDQLVISNWATALPLCDPNHFDAENRVHGIELLGQDQFMRIQSFKPWHGFGDPRQYVFP